MTIYCYKHDRELADEIKRHEHAVAAIRRRQAEAQRACRHESTTRHPSPCGDGSWTECDICGAIVKGQP